LPQKHYLEQYRIQHPASSETGTALMPCRTRVF
jgi:hypothetical protein